MATDLVGHIRRDDGGEGGLQRARLPLLDANTIGTTADERERAGEHRRCQRDLDAALVEDHQVGQHARGDHAEAGERRRQRTEVGGDQRDCDGDQEDHGEVERQRRAAQKLGGEQRRGHVGVDFDARHLVALLADRSPVVVGEARRRRSGR